MHTVNISIEIFVDKHLTPLSRNSMTLIRRSKVVDSLGASDLAEWNGLITTF